MTDPESELRAFEEELRQEEPMAKQDIDAELKRLRVKKKIVYKSKKNI
jgi:hypothetical protein